MRYVETMGKAFEIAYKMIGEYKLDIESSKNAGYNIWRSTSDSRAYISELGDRIEINTADGKSLNVWVDGMSNKVRELEAKIKEQDFEIIKLKAKLYDFICKEKE